MGIVLRRAVWAAVGYLALGASQATALPTGGAVTAGAANFSKTATGLTVDQSSSSVAINWQSFGIGAGESVAFVQPNSNSVALNRVIGQDPSVILGSLTANGKVFLVNANGILFAKGAQVNVGGLVASTLNISDANFAAGSYKFTGNGGVVLNAGSIVADGGYVALLGGSVSSKGYIAAKMGVVILAAGSGITLDVAGDGLMSVVVDKGAVNGLVENGGMIVADGGSVVLTARGAGLLLKTVVNNTGVIEAQTLDNHGGSIQLLGDADSGTLTQSGTLDASAPNGGNGGSIETSAASVNIANGAIVTTASNGGATGVWLIDPVDFTVSSSGNISGATLSALLVTNSVVIDTLAGSDATVTGAPPVTTLHTTTTGNGDINVNEAVSWVASPSTTTLTFNADRDVNVNAAITATNGNIVVCCGRDVNINAPITTTNGSQLLSAGRNVVLAQVASITATDGNITLCAGLDVDVNGAITETRGASSAAQSLNLAPGLVLISGNGGTGPGWPGGP